MATYLVSASKRKNFALRLNTTVTRVLRNGDTATGVEVESTGPDGLSGTIRVTPKTGRVILSAGVFNTYKILLRSGIGPTTSLQHLSNSSSPTERSKLPPKKHWIDRPVGHNLDDGPNMFMAVAVPGVEYFPWEQLWNGTRDTPEIRQYLESRSGRLAELQPSLGPVSWDEVVGGDGRTRVVQWDSSSGRSALLPGDGKHYLSPNLVLCYYVLLLSTLLGVKPDLRSSCLPKTTVHYRTTNSLTPNPQAASWPSNPTST
jgi:cellobiose dehydrogenase (acceptor)